MKTTVLLPAHNEAFTISRTLDSLPRDLVDPIVVLNGCEDDTKSIVQSYGVQIYEYLEKGKLPAIQATLKQLGKKSFEPMLLLDADSEPLFPKQWHDTLLASLVEDPRSTYVSAPVLFSRRPNGQRGEAIALTAFRQLGGLVQSTKNIERGKAAYYGPNQGIKLDQQSLERVVELPHYWPKEDVAMARAIVKDEEGVMHQLTSLRSAVRSQVSASMPPLHHWITRGIKTIDTEITKKYRESAPPASIPYDSQP